MSQSLFRCLEGSYIEFFLSFTQLLRKTEREVTRKMAPPVEHCRISAKLAAAEGASAHIAPMSLNALCLRARFARSLIAVRLK